MSNSASMLILMIVFSLSVGQSTVESQDSLLKLLSDMNELANRGDSSTSNGTSSPNIDFSGIALTALSVASGLITVISFLDRVLIPQPTTAEDTLRIVEKLADSLRPDVEGQFKAAEDTISRALHDMSVMPIGNPTEFQTLLWLERARYLDGDIILLMDGLLGQQVAGGDLLENIKDKLKVGYIETSFILVNNR